MRRIVLLPGLDGTGALFDDFVRAAERQRIAAMVLCNTFVTPPRSRAFGALPLAPLFHLPMPTVVARWFFVGREAPDDLVERVQATVASVPPAVLATRVS